MLDVQVVFIDLYIVCVGFGETESTPKDQNEAEVDEMSKDIPATAMKEDDVYFIIFGEAKGIDAGYITPVSNSFEGVIENGLDANIERWRYCTSKHGFESRVKVWNSYMEY